ncbi:hypothetical protein GTGU_04153 [Trabulsiella guamensis ATCC 49490]|uniref:Uncharacterized protein n=1 Tax=Trabulsiella guamensis ATCC 49490 TaxID=1005994 RepID=A0A084ZNV8_9ENTR|nr:hypothetical protein [Trabulsiella guamensis]KFB99152.1 hypothetical protein GTGU_04153 [Trabulsiella guamensis ATCC 49490]
MSDMYNLQSLIDVHYNCTPDVAKDVYTAADEAGSTISFGIASIGNLMYFASENKEYGEDSMRSDMLNIGLLMRCLGNFQLAIGTAESNAELSLRQSREGKSR